MNAELQIAGLADTVMRLLDEELQKAGEEALTPGQRFRVKKIFRGQAKAHLLSVQSQARAILKMEADKLRRQIGAEPAPIIEDESDES